MKTVTFSYIIEYLNSIIKQQMRGFSVITFAEMSLVILIFLFLIMFVGSRIRNRKFSWKRFIKLFLLFCYICFMFQVAVYRREPGSRHLISSDIDFGSLSGDFLSVQQVVYCLLNIAFFIPIGFLFMLQRWNMDETEASVKADIMVTLCCFILSFSIECIQLVTSTGFFELTDIIVNTGGGFIGAFLALLLLKAWQKWFQQRKDEI